MDKLAQERSWWNKRREQFGFLGKTFEGLSPEFKRTMEKVRKVDERTRDLAVQTRDLLKSAKKFYAKRDYLSTVAALSEFHKRTRQIASEFEHLRINIDEKQYRALLEQYDDDQKEQLFGYDPKHKIEPLKEEEEVDDGLSSEASDWWFDLSNSTEDVNFARERSRVMKAFERLFTVSFFQKLKQESAKMLEESEIFQKQLLSSFKQLDRAMSRRKLADYLGAASEFVKTFGSYHDRFVRYHEAYVKPLKEHHAKMMEERKVKEEKEKAEVAKQEALRRMQEHTEEQRRKQSLEALKQRSQEPTGQTSLEPKPFDVRKETLMYQPTGLEELSNVSNENEPIDLTKQKAANEEFIDRLEAIAEENDPRMMVLEILAHSDELEEVDPEGSLRLVSIAEGIIEDYKTAGIFDFFKGKPEEKEEEEEPVPLV